MTASLITGATGFIGACLARRLVAQGHEVHLLVRPEHQMWRIAEIRDDVRLHEVSLEDSDRVTAAVHSIRPRWVFHLAAYGAYSWQADLARMLQTNVLGTMNLLQASLSAGVETLVNTGSSSEYGLKNHPPAESEALEPNSHYAVTKVAATLFCQHTARTNSMRLPTLRLYSVYGPYEEPLRLVPSLVLHAMRGGLPQLVQPEVARDYVYVEDVVDAYLLAARTPHKEPGAVYNIGTGMQTTLAQIVEIVRDLLKVSVPPKWGTMPPREWDTTTWVSNSRKAEYRLGWIPRYELATGLRGFIDWLHGRPELLAFYYRSLDERSC